MISGMRSRREIIPSWRMDSHLWEKDGQKRSKLVVIGEKLHLMPKRGEKADESAVEIVSEESVENYKPTLKPSKKKKEDEVPF